MSLRHGLHWALGRINLPTEKANLSMMQKLGSWLLAVVAVGAHVVSSSRQHQPDSLGLCNVPPSRSYADVLRKRAGARDDSIVVWGADGSRYGAFPTNRSGH